MSTTNQKLTQVSALQALAQQLKVKIPTKVSQLNNDSGYQTAAQVEASINARLSSTYRPGGSVAFSNLPTADEVHLGMVYNVTDEFTTTDSFVEGVGSVYPAGTNVVVVEVGSGDSISYKYDALAGFVDLSEYAKTANVVIREEGKVLSDNNYTDADKAKLDGLEFATDAEITAMLNEVFGS